MTRASSSIYLYAALTLVLAALVFALAPKFIATPRSTPAVDVAPPEPKPQSGAVAPLAPGGKAQPEASRPNFSLFEPAGERKPLPNKGVFSSHGADGATGSLTDKPGGLFGAPGEGR